MSDFPIPASEVLYHDPPMALLDELLEERADGVLCGVKVGADSMFSSSDGVPSYIGLEYMAQTTAAFVGVVNRRKGLPPPLGYLVASGQVELDRDFMEVGGEFLVSARRVWDGEKIAQFECEVRDRRTDERVSRARLSVYTP